MSSTAVQIRTETPVLRLSSDRKVSPLVRRQKSKDAAQVPNSFGLPAGASCPGRTSFCDGCYAENLERAWSTVSRLLEGNLAALLTAGDDVDRLAEMLRTLIGDFRSEVTKRARLSKVDAETLLTFRIHWDGDFYSEPYAAAWAVVIAENPDIRFWAYTRSIHAGCNVVPILAGLENLALYISTDAENAGRAAEVLAEHPDVQVAACGETWADTEEILATVDRTAPKCPELTGRLPLVVAADGRRSTPLNVGENGRGACDACGLCINGRAGVRFAIDH